MRKCTKHFSYTLYGTPLSEDDYTQAKLVEKISTEKLLKYSILPIQNTYYNIMYQTTNNNR